MGFLSKNKNNKKIEQEEEKIQTEQEQSEISQSEENDAIECYDEYGRKILVSRDEMRKNVLPKQFKSHWDSADALYNDIILAFNDGFNEEALEAAKHLINIDEIKERGYTILAIAYMNNSIWDEAENTLNEYINAYGKTGIILSNLARIQYAKKDIDKAFELMWESLCLDPNQENGLQWWAALNIEAGGEEQYVASIEKAATIEGSWLPQLFHARYFLEKRDLESAKPIYDYVLKTAVDELPVLFIISGDLGSNGYIKEIVDIVAPAYDDEKHDIMAGLNLIHAYIQTGNYIAGEELVNKLMRIQRPDIRSVLTKMSTDLERIKEAELRGQSLPEKVEYELVVTDKPIWYYGLNNPEWLLPETLINKNIGLLTFVDLTEKSDSKPGMQREDDIGRMTRSLPLLLQEVFLYKLNLESKFLIPLAKGIGPVIPKSEYTIETLSEVAKSNNIDLLITGSVTTVQDGIDIDVIIFESKNQSIKTQKMKLSSVGENIDFINSLNSMIAKMAEINKVKVTKFDLYNIPSQEIVANYLIALGQALMQSLVDNKYIKFENMLGERNSLIWYLNFALDVTENLIPKIMFISGLAKSKSYGSEVYKEFQEQAVKLFSDDKLTSGTAKLLLPFIYYLYDMEEELKAIKTDKPNPKSNLKVVH